MSSMASLIGALSSDGQILAHFSPSELRRFTKRETAIDRSRSISSFRTNRPLTISFFSCRVLAFSHRSAISARFSSIPISETSASSATALIFSDRHFWTASVDVRGQPRAKYFFSVVSETPTPSTSCLIVRLRVLTARFFGFRFVFDLACCIRGYLGRKEPPGNFCQSRTARSALPARPPGVPGRTHDFLGIDGILISLFTRLCIAINDDPQILLSDWDSICLP